MVPARDRAAMDKDEIARRVAHAMFAREGTGPAWDLQIREVREGYARLAMMVRPDMANGHGSVHGGMLFSLADTAFAYACNSRNTVSVAQAASVVYLAPAGVGETLVAEAREEAVSGRTGVYTVQVTVEGDGRVIAQLQGQSRTIGGAIIDLSQPSQPEP